MENMHGNMHVLVLTCKSLTWKRNNLHHVILHLVLTFTPHYIIMDKGQLLFSLYKAYFPSLQRRLPPVAQAPPLPSFPPAMEYDDEGSCIICYEDMLDTGSSVLSCGHRFHTDVSWNVDAVGWRYNRTTVTSGGRAGNEASIWLLLLVGGLGTRLVYYVAVKTVCVLMPVFPLCLQCIRSWFKEQNTCPTCRNHSLLTDDFPFLGQ